MRARWCALAVAALLPATARGDVAIRDGAFYKQFNDLTIQGGLGITISRQYDSSVHTRGLFGEGWSMPYEVRLRVVKHGVEVNDPFGDGKRCGCGARTYPIADGARRELSSADDIAVGTRFRNPQYPTETVIRIHGGFMRVLDAGKEQRFDYNGRLMLITDHNRSFVRLDYDGGGRLVALSDQTRRRVTLSFNDRGLVEEARGPRGERARYSYDARERLVRAVAPDKREDAFEYDENSGRLTRIAGETANLRVRYKGERVSQIEEGGDVTTYEMKQEALPGGRIKRIVTQDAQRATYEYLIESGPDGERTAQLSKDVEGERTVTTYNRFEYPSSIRRGDEEITFEYDTLNRVTMKVTPTEVSEMSYDPIVNKVSRVVRFPRGEPAAYQRYFYAYSPSGNLIRADDDRGKRVFLTYDRFGRIARMQLGADSAILTFEYNDESRPVRIIANGIGEVTVEYTPTGEIKKVDSKGGRSIALRVTSSFQELLDIVKPAGISFGF
jgi:YD repeat-containing protein